jgi:membrane protease YdiL (CAAX protease family)
MTGRGQRLPSTNTPTAPSAILRSAPVRLVLELAVILGLTLALHAATTAIVDGLGIPSAYFPIFLVLAVPVLVLAYRFLVRWLERRDVTELGRSTAARELCVGLAVGFTLFAVTIGVVAMLGGYSIVGRNSLSTIGVPLGSAIAAGFTEELVMRGVLFRITEEWLGSWAAIVISSVLFGLLHLGTPHATGWSTAAIALEAGTMLAAAYMRTHRLWFPMGVHAAWNFTQGGIFGVAVSGTASKGLLQGELHGPAWLTGGEFGAEASAIAVIVCFAGAALLIAGSIRAGRIVAPSWAR